MPGYVAIALLESSMIRMDRPALDEPPLAMASLELPAPIEDVRVVRSLAAEQLRSRGDTLRERKAALRRAWEQTTFYLFDAESWR